MSIYPCTPSHRALKIVDDSAENHSEEASELQRLIDMRLKCFNNMAAAQLKVSLLAVPYFYNLKVAIL